MIITGSDCLALLLQEVKHTVKSTYREAANARATPTPDAKADAAYASSLATVFATAIEAIAHEAVEDLRAAAQVASTAADVFDD
jgi:hypothetical protein